MTISNKTVEYIKNGYTWGIGFQSIFYFITGSLCLALMYVASGDIWGEPAGKCVIISLVLFGLISFVNAFHTKPTYKEINQYEAIIDENTSFYDVYNNYDVVEQQGDIFILRDKN